MPFLKALAVGMVHVYFGNAIIEWPTTSRAHPSWWVWIVLTPKGPRWEGASSYFPMKVRWDVWDSVVAPQFKEYDWKVPLDTLVANLHASLQANGFLPSDLEVVEDLPLDVPQTIEPEPEGTIFVNFDTEVGLPVFAPFDV